MEPEEFLKYWDVSREEIATICDCSVVTVNFWFAPSSHRRPKENHKQQLALAHHIWTAIETEPTFLQKMRDMYSPERKRLQ